MKTIVQIVGPKPFNSKAFLFPQIIKGWQVHKWPVGFNELQGAQRVTPPQGPRKATTPTTEECHK